MRSSKRFIPTVFVAATLSTVACPAGDGDGDGDGDGEKGAFECELGILDTDDAFVAAGDDTRAELELGFQGFLFVEVVVRAVGDVPSLVVASSRITVDGDAPTGQETPGVGMAARKGGYMSDPVLLFFNSDTPADLADRWVDVVVKLEDEKHTCTAAGTLLLVDDDPCIHTGDEPICPGDPDTGQEREVH